MYVYILDLFAELETLSDLHAMINHVSGSERERVREERSLRSSCINRVPCSLCSLAYDQKHVCGFMLIASCLQTL